MSLVLGPLVAVPRPVVLVVALHAADNRIAREESNLDRIFGERLELDESPRLQQNSEKNMKFINSAVSLFWTTPHRWGPECHRKRQIRAFRTN